MATWTFAVSDTYAERVGAEGVEALVQVLTEGARQAPGRNPAEIEDVLKNAAKQAGIGIAEPELKGMAGNLSLHDLETVVVTNDVGAEIARIPVANDVTQIPEGERSDNVHLEPGDSRRPGIS